MSTFEERQAWVNEIRAAIQSGEIEATDGKTLSKFSRWLCDPAIQGHFNGQDYRQVSDVIQHHMLRALIEGFEARNNAMQWWVIALAVAALVASVVQAGVAIWAEVRVSREAAPANLLAQPSTMPTTPAPPSASSVQPSRSPSVPGSK